MDLGAAVGGAQPPAEPAAVALLQREDAAFVGLERFDGVTAFFSLLMLPRAEIPHALAIVRDLLVPDGWCARPGAAGGYLMERDA